MKEYPSTYRASVTLKNLPEDAIPQYDSQDLEFVFDMVAFPECWRKDITGVAELIGDGEILAIWFTESASPWDLTANYHPLPFYAERREVGDPGPEYWQETNEFYNTPKETKHV